MFLKIENLPRGAPIFGRGAILWGAQYVTYPMRKNAKVGPIHLSLGRLTLYLSLWEAFKPRQAIKITKTKNGAKILENPLF